jgi:hypothetical protein
VIALADVPESHNQIPSYNVGIASALDKIESGIYLIVALFLGIMALLTFFIVAGNADHRRADTDGHRVHQAAHA